MNAAQRNNNPCNLRYAHQTEASGKDDKDFATFPTPMAGWRAVHAQIKLDQDRGLTLRQFIAKFAPPNENNTSQYLELCVTNLQVPPDALLKNISRYALAGVMAQEEGYYNFESL